MSPEKEEKIPDIFQPEQIYQKSFRQDLEDEEFEKFWNEGTDFKEEFIRILDESKLGTKEYRPFSIFIKSLYELQKDDILYQYETPETLPSSEVDLSNFQEDAVKRIY